jgi:glycosyltransferase involved in cell wall biosynthesis
MLLCFGHIRDNKNIDLLIRAIAGFGNIHLVVAGPAAASGQRAAGFYVNLAAEVGVRDRVHVIPRYIPDDEVAAYFERADWIAITYTHSFVSQSGVLNVAARARKPMLGSSGPSPMKSVLEKYRLGVFVEPDSLQALVGGLRALIDNPPKPDWGGYEAYASWEANARVILSASGLSERR